MLHVAVLFEVLAEEAGGFTLGADLAEVLGVCQSLGDI
jgi:hypothetical protein